MMGNGWMMQGYGYNNANLIPLIIGQAQAAPEKHQANLNNSVLEIAEIMNFDNNGYVIVRETSTGIGAFELFVDPVSQITYPEAYILLVRHLLLSEQNRDMAKILVTA